MSEHTIADALLGQKIDKLAERFESLENTVDPLIKLTPKLLQLVEALDSVMFGKKFLIGVATVVGSIAAIGGGVFWVVDYIRHGR